MNAEGSVTNWMNRLAGGDPTAASELWKRYCNQLERLARKHLAAHPRRAADEQDVANSAFRVFCMGAMQGRFPDLHDRDNLWRLLVVITARKAADYVKMEGRRPPVLSGPDDQQLIEQAIGREPTPEFAALMTQQCERLLSALDDPALRTVAVKKLEGYSNDEIAAQLGCSLRTIERKVWRIRAEWGQYLEETK